MRGIVSCVIGILASIHAGSAAYAAQDVLLATDEAYPPYSFKSGDDAVGIYPEILAKVFSMMPGYRVILLPAPWKRAVRMAESGEVLGVVPPYRRDDLRPWMEYTDPLFEEKIVAICRNDIATKVADKPYPGGYGGMVFGNISGSRAGGEMLHAMAAAGLVTIEEAKTTKNNLKKIATGRIDCYVDDSVSIESTWKKMGATDTALKRNFSKVANVSGERTYIGLTGTKKYPFKDDFVREFNARLSELKGRGEIDRIIENSLK